jgi:hypothetical protein
MDDQLKFFFQKSNYDLIKKIIKVKDADISEIYDECNDLGYPEKPGGSLWTNEGKLIYILIRLLKPANILELGNFKGASTNFILSALKKNNKGKLVLVDLVENLEYNNLHDYPFIRYVDSSIKFLKREIKFDFILIDDNHEYEHVKKELNLIRSNNKAEKYIIWGHDYFAKTREGVNVKKAVDEESIHFDSFYKSKTDESNCGQYILIKKRK